MNLSEVSAHFRGYQIDRSIPKPNNINHSPLCSKPYDDNDSKLVGLQSSGLPNDDPGNIRLLQCRPLQRPQIDQKSCHCKIHGRKRNTDMGMKYIQPPVPSSYKPEARYKTPDYKMESGTVYRLSYPGIDPGSMRVICSAPKCERNNIKFSSMPLSQDTTFRLSYTGIQGERAVSCKPVLRYSLMGKGPMQSTTTQRHDYTLKNKIERSLPVLIPNNIHLSSAKMEDNTTMRLSYQPVEGERVQSYKPVNVYKKSEYKLEQDTINRLSYQPWEATPREKFPWQKRPEYQQPSAIMENNTIYRASFLPNEGVTRARPFKVETSFKPSDRKFAQETIYRESYQDSFNACSPAKPIARTGNIFPSTMPMSQDTTFRLSYTGAAGDKAMPYKPCNKSMMGAGPMQSVTTQSHDYTPKPFVTTPSYKPKHVPITSNFKMEDMTTFRASYIPNDVIPRVESFKPISVYRKPIYCLEADTINRLSYQPWEAGPREQYPWMKKREYQQPTSFMEDTTVYRGSYIAPGNYVPDEHAATGEEICTCTCYGESKATDDL